MNQSAFALGALAGVLCAAVGSAAALLLLFGRRRGQPLREDATYKAAFDQWPTTAMVLDSVTLGIIAANPSAQRSLGYSLEELRNLSFGELFKAEGMDSQALLEKLRVAPPRTYIEMRQFCRDGSQRTVEAVCYPITLDKRPGLAVAVHDVTVRRKIETQLLEKQQHLEHLAHHDQLTGLPNRLYLAAHLPRAIEEASATAPCWRCCFWTWTASSRSTIRADTRPATNC